MLGLKLGHVYIADYDPQWPVSYIKEKKLIENALSEDILEIHHIGSTSIPGLSAKPVVDIAVLIPSFESLDVYKQSLSAIGYEYVFYFRERHFFRKGNEKLSTHHLHLYELDNSILRDDILFRNYLTSHPDTRRKYEQLKLSLQKKFENDREAYLDGKADFIQHTLKIARKEKRQNDLKKNRKIEIINPKTGLIHSLN